MAIAATSLAQQPAPVALPVPVESPALQPEIAAPGIDNGPGTPQVMPPQTGPGIVPGLPGTSTTTTQTITTQTLPPIAPTMTRSEDGGMWVRAMDLNDFLAVLAKRAKLQYFSNPSLDGHSITGHVTETGDPIEQMRAVCLQHGMTLYRKSGTIYALDEKQVNLLPRREFVYTVKYLRGRSPDDQKRLIDLVKPVMSSRGEVRYEDKTGTLLVVDNEAAVESVKRILELVDVSKRQIIVEVKVLRITNSRSNRLGFDWSATLGSAGLSIGATAQGKLSSLFGTTPSFGVAQAATGGTSGGGTGTGTGTGAVVPVVGSTDPAIILDPLTVKTVLRALNEANLATQENSPVVITEDNEQGVIRITDRIPIIEQTVTQTDGTNNITSDVRYKIDKSDSIEPEKSREIGVTVTVTPTILPDGTIRLKLFPRVASVTEFITIQTGVEGFSNQVPRVGEVSVETMARIPNGYSLLLGGYYQTEERVSDNKVPLLGDLPGVGFFFRSKQRTKDKANIAFLLTATTYDPASDFATVSQSERIRQAQVRPKSMDFPDDENPGENEKARPLTRTRNFFPFFKKKPATHPLSSESVAGVPRVLTPQQRKEEEIKRSLRGQ